MAINFFEKECQETTDEDCFGICDLVDKTPAFISTIREEKWIAIVHNKEKTKITFTAIDNCIPIYRPNGEMESRCDGMLTYEKNIIFVELKNVKKRRNKIWREEGIEQIKTTIQIFSSNHNLSVFEKKELF